MTHHQYDSPDGVPQRLITEYEWRVGQVEVDLERGVVRLPFVTSESHLVRLPTGGLLSQFLRFSDDPVPAQTLARFARRYGLLGLCPHGLPMSWPHEEHCSEPRIEEPGYFVEDLTHWQLWARRFRALQDAADLLLKKDRIKNETDVPAVFEKLSPAFEGLSDWKLEARRTLDAEPTMRNPKGWVRRRNLLCRWLNHLLLTGNVRRAVVPQLPGWNLELRDGPSGGSPLFGSLVLEAVSDAMGGVRQVQCKGCGQTFDPTSSSARYCEDCGARARWLRAQRKRRADFHARGLSTRGRRLGS
jgi:hypothetical protein